LKLAEHLNRIGELSLSYGIKTLYHNHTRGIGESFNDLERVHSEADASKVGMMLDTGHATKDFHELPPQERAITFLKKYWDRIEFMEFKDWNEHTDLNTPLGEGECDYESIFAQIRSVGYEGWILVEQNYSEKHSLGRSPKECAVISREYIRQGIGI